jgi:hypothetical protein
MLRGSKGGGLPLSVRLIRQVCFRSPVCDLITAPIPSDYRGLVHAPGMADFPDITRDPASLTFWRMYQPTTLI